MATLALVGGPADGRRLLLVRPPDFRVRASAIGVALRDGGGNGRYELTGDSAEGEALLYQFKEALPDDLDEEDAEIMRRWAERWSESRQPDGVLRHKTRVFLDGGPVDGSFLFVLCPPELSMAGMELELLLDAEQSARCQHGYKITPAWREPEGLGADVLVFQHAEIKAAPATLPGA